MEEILRGYVVRTVPYLENDAIITLISETKGIVSFKARGVQKPTSKNNPSCQLFVKGEYLLDYKQEDGHRRLRSGTVVAGRSPMFYENKQLIVLTLASEGLLKMEETDIQDSYPLFHDLCTLIQTTPFDFATAILVLLSQFMNRSGCMLVADHCVVCGKTTNIGAVSYDEGGYLCHTCLGERNSRVQTVTYLKYFRIILKAKIENIAQFRVPDEVAHSMIIDFFNYIEKQVGIRFKSQAMIIQMLRE